MIPMPMQAIIPTCQAVHYYSIYNDVRVALALKHTGNPSFAFLTVRLTDTRGQRGLGQPRE